MPPPEEPTVTDPVGLLRHLESSGRFHRDTGFGRIFHPGHVSFRENLPTDSLHVLVHDNRIAAHVDRVSPLGLRPEAQSRYSLRRAAAHNVAGMAQDLVRLVRGRQGDHRCHLDCEWVWDRSEGMADPGDLLEPEASDWSVQLEARVTGTLDESRLRAALAATLGAHAISCDPLEVVECPDDASLDAARARLQTTVVPVTDWPPVRAYLARHPAGDMLMLNLNHAATDGFGAVGALRAVARTYSGTGEPGGGALDQERGAGGRLEFLSFSDLPVRPASAPVSWWVQAHRRTVESVRDLMTRPARLASDQAWDDPGHGFHLLSLPPEQTRLLVDADRPGTSRNVVLAALHLAIGDWNLRHGQPGRRVGVLVPINLRPPEWPEETGGNLSVTARVSTSRRHRAGPATALPAVTAQTTRNKRTRTGIALIAALERAGLLPLWAKQSLIVLQPLTGNLLVDTAMLCNLGWLDEPPRFEGAGDTVGIWFSTPARTPSSLCVGAVTVAGRLHLTLRYPHRLFGPDAARRFGECLEAQLRLMAEYRR